MFSGGEINNSCHPTLTCLYDNFRTLHTQMSTFQGNETPVLQREGYDVKLSKKSDELNDHWIAYERKYTTKEGQARTVQIAMHFSHMMNTYALKIFGSNGGEIAHTENSDSSAFLVISQKQKARGDDVLIKSALKAVTGEDYEVEVE